MLLRLSISMPVPATSRLHRYFTVIVRWFMILGLVFCGVVLLGQYITTHWLPQKYTATAQVDLKLNGSDVVGSTTPTGEPQPSAQESAISAQMRSSSALLPVIHDLDLNRVWAKRVFNEKDDLSDEEALAHLNKILKLDLVRDTNIINIYVTEDAPNEAAAIANALIDHCKTMRDDARIIARAEVPTKASHPIADMATIIIACIVAVLAASFTEMILLFQRAAERHGN